VDIGRSIQYWLQDPNWIKKVLIGGLLTLIPFIGWMIVGGYMIRTVQRVGSGMDQPLPEWGEWGDDLARGFKLLVLIIVWMLPVWAITILTIGLSVVDETAGGVAGIMLNCLVFIYSIAFYFIFPILVGRLAAREQLTDGFDVSGIIQDAQKIPSQLLIFLVVYIAASVVAGFGIILCIIGVIFTSFIAYLVIAHMVGQIGGMLGYFGGPPNSQGPGTTPPPPPHQGPSSTPRQTI
jgi:hypothetical protein